MKKEAKVHMLPTNGKDIAMLSKRVKDGMLQSANGPEGVANCNTMWQPQHLYILSDEEIKKGDWFINLGSGGHPGVAIYQANSENSKSINEFKFPEIKKIIATTNTELHYNKVVEKDMHMYKESLPHIPQHIIEAYIKKPFDEVLVEYKEYIKCTNCNLTEEDCECNVSYTQDLIGIDRVKLNPDNTIIIHPVKEMYTADSINTLRKLANAIIGPASEILPDTYDKELKAYWDWIEENL